MSISARIILSIAIYIFLISLGAVLIWNTSRHMTLEGERIQFTKNILTSVTARRGLIIEYLLNPNDRIVDQWNIASLKFDTLLNTPLPQSSKNQVLIEEIGQGKRVTDSVFQELTEEEVPQMRVALVNRMLIESQSVISKVNQLIDHSLSDLAAAQKLLVTFFLTFVGVLFGGIIGTWFFLERNIVRPILKLTSWTDTLAKTDFTTVTPIGIKTRDEIGKLASSFELMTVKLRESYEGLEGKVKERTEDLTKQTSELERINALMTGRELKMIELKKEIETLKEKLKKHG